MAYIGNQSNSTVSTIVSNNTKRACRFQAGSTFTADYMGVGMGPFQSGDKIILGIYSDDAGGPGALLGVTGEIIGYGQGWYHAALISGVSITSGSYYWLAVIATGDTQITRSGSGSHEYNNDTYSDGFADPFGSPSGSGSENYCIYASDVIPFITGGGLDQGGATVTTSVGTKITFLVQNVVGVGSAIISVYKDVDGIPDQFIAVPGGFLIGNNGYLHAAIDSNDTIHIVAAGHVEAQGVVYGILSDPDGTPSWGSWEAILDTYTSGNPSVPGVKVSIDSNDKPHVLFVDYVAWMGTSVDNVFYTEKTGASWATPTQIGERAVKTDVYRYPNITLRNSDNIEVHYSFGGPSNWKKRTYTTSWSAEANASSGTSFDRGHVHSVISTTGGTVYYYRAGGATGSIYEDTTDTAYNAQGSVVNIISPVLVDDSVRYIFYVPDSDDDIHLLSNDGGGWTDEGTIQVGTYQHVIAEWAYNYENQVDEISYIFEASEKIYYGSFDLGGTQDDLTAVGITANPVLDTPTIGQKHALSATGITANPVLATPTVTEIVNLTATGITVTPVLDTPTVTRIPNLTAVGITADPVMGTPVIGQIHALLPVTALVNPVLDAPTMGQTHILVAVDITANPVLDSPVVAQTHPLDAVGITANPVLDAPAIAQAHVLDAVDITANPVLDIPTMGQTHVLVSVGITTTPVLGIPTAGIEPDNLTAVDITVDPVLGTPAIAQIHVLDAVDITADPVLDTPAIARIPHLTAVDITADPVTGAPIIGQIHALLPVTALVNPVLDVPTIGQTHILVAIDITADPVLDIPTIARIPHLTAVDITADPVLGTPAIGQIHVLDAVDITANPVLGTPVLGSEGEDNLEADDATTTPVLGTPAIAQTHALSANGIITTPVLDTPALGFIYILDAIGIESAPVVGTPVIGQIHALSSTGIVATPEVGIPVFGQAHVLDASGFTTTPVLESPAIGQIHVLDSVTIVVSPILGVPIVGQTHILDGVGITTTPDIGVASWELVDGKVVVIFSAYQPELEFSAYQPELEFTVVHMED